MSKATEAARIAGIRDKVGRDVVTQFGGFLRCEDCCRVQSLDTEQGGRYLSSGWPKCCGYTMGWWTARQIAAGEVDA